MNIHRIHGVNILEKDRTNRPTSIHLKDRLCIESSNEYFVLEGGRGVGEEVVDNLLAKQELR